MNWTFKQIDSLKVLPSLEKLSLGDNNGDTDLGGEKGLKTFFGSTKVLKYLFLVLIN